MRRMSPAPSFPFLIMFLAVAISLTGAGAAEHGPATMASKKIAVLNFSTNNAPEFLSRVVRNVMEVTLFATGEFQLLEWEQIQNILQGSKWRDKKDLDVADAIELGRKLQADFLVAGSIDKIEEYRITARVVAVADKKILLAYSKKFSSENDIDRIAEKMAQDLNRDIDNYVKTGSLDRRFYDTFSILVGAYGEYVNPVGALKGLVNGGGGASIMAGVENIFLENFYLGLNAGYHRFSGKENSSDTLSMVPLGIDVGYKLQLHRRIFLQPLITPGLVFLSMKHGSDPGFDMDPDSVRTYCEPMLSAGLAVGVSPLDCLHLKFSVKYGMIYEPDDLYHLFRFGLGIAGSF